MEGKKITEDVENKVQSLENEKNDEIIFKPLQEWFNRKQEIIWYLMKRTPTGQCVSNKAISYHLFPRKPYEGSQKTRVSNLIKDLKELGYIEEIKRCLHCGVSFKSLPQICPTCEFRILDINMLLLAPPNRNKGKNPHKAYRLTQRAVDEMGMFYRSMKGFIEQYENIRKFGIKNKAF